MTTIKANVSDMFANIEPYLVSGSRAELGNNAGRLTWKNALKIAEDRANWLESSETEACAGICDWASRTGAWTDDEIESWSPHECIALFVQNVASEMRMLGSDDNEFEACATKYAMTDWDKESEYPTGYYYYNVGSVRVEYYTGG